MYDTVQQASSLLQSEFATRMANGTGLHFSRYRFHKYDDSTAGWYPLGSQCYPCSEMDGIYGHGAVLPGSSFISYGLPHRRNWRTTVSATELPSSRYFLHSFRSSIMDHGNLGVIRRQSLSAAFLAFLVYQVYLLHVFDIDSLYDSLSRLFI